MGAEALDFAPLCMVTWTALIGFDVKISPRGLDIDGMSRVNLDQPNVVS